MREHIDAFLLACRSENLSVRTVGWYAAHLREFAEFANGGGVSADVVREFVVSLGLRSLSPYSVHGSLRTLRRFFRWCVAEGRLSVNPMTRVAMPKLPRRVPRGVSDVDFRRLLAACAGSTWLDVRDRALLLLLRDTGCRSGEIANLEMANVDLEKAVIRVIGKGGQERFAFLSVPTVEAIREWQATRVSGGARLFCSRGGEFSTTTLSQMLRRLKKKAEITGRVNPHSFRHGFARDWLLSGGDLASLSQTLGHRDLQTTMIYAQFAVADLQAKHGRHSPLCTN